MLLNIQNNSTIYRPLVNEYLSILVLYSACFVDFRWGRYLRQATYDAVSFQNITVPRNVIIDCNYLSLLKTISFQSNCSLLYHFIFNFIL